MTLERSVVVPGVLVEYRSFGELLGGLSDEQWQSPSRCAGWSVADVAGHVVGQLSDVTAFRLEGLGTPEATARQVEERRGRTAADLAEELGATTRTAADLIGSFDDDAYNAEGPQRNGQTLGYGIESLWFDTFLHADDIRVSYRGDDHVDRRARALGVAHHPSAHRPGLASRHHSPERTRRVPRRQRERGQGDRGRSDGVHPGLDRPSRSRTARTRSDCQHLSLNQIDPC